MSSQWDGTMKSMIFIEQYLNFVSQKIDVLKQNWDKFYRQYSMNMQILKDSY